MNRPYTAQSPYSLTPTERIRTPRGGRRYGRGHEGADHAGDPDTDAIAPYPGDDLGDYDDGPVENYDDYDDDDYDDDEARIDRRWMWIAGVAGAILFVAVITASLILGGGDSGSVSATIASPEPTSDAAPEPSSPPRLAGPAAPSLPAETVTTVSPAPSPTAEAPTAQAQPPAPVRPHRRPLRLPWRPPHRHLPDHRQPPAHRPGDGDLHRSTGRVGHRRERRAAVDEDGGAEPWRDTEFGDRDQRRGSAQLQHRRRQRHTGRRAEQQRDHHQLHAVADPVRPGRAHASGCCACAAAGRRNRSSATGPRPTSPDRPIRHGRRGRTGPG